MKQRIGALWKQWQSFENMGNLFSSTDVIETSGF